MITGKTTDGKLVMDGKTVFRLYDETGLPLFMVFQVLHENNMIPDWISFYETAIAQGWAFKTIMARLDEALGDAYDKEMKEGILKRLNFYFYAIGKGLYRYNEH
jgi:alanyl-tRNA synthetase